MVGMAVGAGDFQRARRVAWTAGMVSAFNLGLLGLVVAIAPDLWAGLFTDDAEVLTYARQYLRWAGPGFAFFGLGVTLYFASQGSGHMLGPVLAGTVRLVLVAGVGAVLVASDAPAWQLFALVSAGMVVYGLATVVSIRLTPWRSRKPVRKVSREPAHAPTGSLAAHAPSPPQPHS
jgi:Na+-driven multidrug efflux pump